MKYKSVRTPPKFCRHSKSRPSKCCSSLRQNQLQMSRRNEGPRVASTLATRGPSFLLDICSWFWRRDEQHLLGLLLLCRQNFGGVRTDLYFIARARPSTQLLRDQSADRVDAF